MTLVERDIAGSALDGVSDIDWVLPPTRDYPVRQLNRRIELPNLASCGRPYGSSTEGENGWTPVLWVNGEYRARLATCSSALLCDRCSPIAQAESRARWLWHFEDHLAGGGQLLHLRLSGGHTPADDFAPLRDRLVKAFELLRRLKVWRELGVVGFVRVLHVRLGRAGWHPHLHVTVLVRAGFDLDLEAKLPELQAAWKDRLVKAGFKRASRKGLFGRMFASALDALYAWSWADDDDSDRYHPNPDLHPQNHLDGVDYHPQRGWDDDDGDDGDSWSTWDLARAAIAGDARAFAKWSELAHAMSGFPVVSCSDSLDELWGARLGELEDDVASVGAGPGGHVVPDPAFKVGNKLVGRASSAGLWDAALLRASEVRRSGGSGVLAFADAVSAGLGCQVVVDVDGFGLPMVWADSIGPPGSTGEPVVVVMCDVEDLEV